MARRRKSPLAGVPALAVALLVLLNPFGVRDWAIGQFVDFQVERAERRAERLQESIDEQMRRMQTPTVTPSSTAKP